MTYRHGNVGQDQAARVGSPTTTVPRAVLFATFERLPPSVRQAMLELDFNISPIKVLQVLMDGVPEEFVIEALRQQNRTMLQNAEAYRYQEAQRLEKEHNG